MICKQLAQMMQGDLTVNSVLGEGSTFTLSGPATVWPDSQKLGMNKRIPPPRRGGGGAAAGGGPRAAPPRPPRRARTPPPPHTFLGDCHRHKLSMKEAHYPHTLCFSWL